MFDTCDSKFESLAYFGKIHIPSKVYIPSGLKLKITFYFTF